MEHQYGVDGGMLSTSQEDSQTVAWNPEVDTRLAESLIALLVFVEATDQSDSEHVSSDIG